MATRLTGVSLPPAMNERLRAEAEATGLKMSTIMQQALAARWATQDANQAA
jgi:DNA-binding transcriptional MocR family regulator